MIQITLEGHDTTKGAHVEVEYLNYTKVDGYVFPREFFERVNAPIAIDTHAWHLTGLDINRDYGLENLNGPSSKRRRGTFLQPTPTIDNAAVIDSS